MDEQRLAGAVADVLGTTAADAPLAVLGRVPNTSDRARALGREGAPHGAMVVAESQTAARGRDGSDWSAPPGGVWTSILLRPDLDADAVGRLTIAGGLATCEAVRTHGVDAGIKWPNDVVVDADGDRRKLAGVLTELVVDAVPVAGKPVEDVLPDAAEEDPEFVLLGVGVNADLDPDAVDSPRATTMRAERGEPVDVTAVATALHERVLARADQAATEDGYATLLDDWRDHAVTLGERVRAARHDGDTVVGTAVDVTDTGALVVVRDADGTRKSLSTATVEHLRRE